MKKHFIFDIDDTLTNSYTVNQQLFVDTFKPYTQDPSHEVFLRDLHYKSRGASMLSQFTEAVQQLKLAIDPQLLVEENEQLHIASVSRFNNMNVFGGTVELLQFLKENGKLISSCTNRQYGSQKKIFEANNIDQYFENVISCADEGHEKPDPYCLLQLISKYDEPKESYIYFGDSKTDRDFAKSAGIDFVIIDHYLNEMQFYKKILQAFF